VVALTPIATPLLVAPVHALGSRLTRVSLPPWIRSSALRDVPATAAAVGLERRLKGNAAECAIDSGLPARRELRTSRCGKDQERPRDRTAGCLGTQPRGTEGDAGRTCAMLSVTNHLAVCGR
jgi:hypothetical protein